MKLIDADAMLAELKPITFEMEHSAVTIADMSNIMRNWVERQPTRTPQNEVLTVEQLREMVGEPVYIIAKNKNIAEWNVIAGIEWVSAIDEAPFNWGDLVAEGISFINGRAFRVESYGTNWVAYRRPPERQERER